MAEQITLPIECICCDTTTTISGNKAAFDSWKNMTRTSEDAFRRVAPDLRRFLTTLICTPCYERA